MKRNLLLKRTRIFIRVFVLFLLCAPLAANADRLLTEDFEYEPGNLYKGQGVAEPASDWVRVGSNPNAAIQVVTPSLTYPGYQGQTVGNAVKLTSTSTGQDLQKKFSELGTGSSTFYVSFLAKFENVGKESGSSATENDFFTLVGATATVNFTTFPDPSSGGEFARIFVKEGSAADKFKIGVTRNNGTAANVAYGTEEYDLNVTYLIVVKYEIVGESVDGNLSTNDAVSLFVNTVGVEEPSTPDAVYPASSSDGDIRTDRDGFIAVQLKQSATSTRYSPNVIIDAIRVATTWEDLFDAPAIVNLVENPGFEEWQQNMLGARRASKWNASVFGEAPTQESEIKKSGNYAIRVTSTESAYIGQALGTPQPDGFIQRDIYELVINYYVVERGENPDDGVVQLDNVWGGNNVDATHDEEALKGKLYATEQQVRQWLTDTIRTSVPENEAYFDIYFRVPAGAVVIFDDISFTNTGEKLPEPPLNLVTDPGFEEWRSNQLGETPEEWETSLLGGVISKESTIIKSGFAAKVTGDSKATYLEQTITNPTPSFVRGDIYELVINYYVVSYEPDENFAGVAQLGNAWGGGNVDVTHDEEDLKGNLYATQTQIGRWLADTIRTSVPKNASSFKINVKVPAGSVVIFDDISFTNTGEKLPYLDAPLTLPALSTTIDTPVQSADITITTGNLPGDVAVAITGADADKFTLVPATTTIPAGQITPTLFKVNYVSSAIGSHTATLSFDAQGAAEINRTISLRGTTTDPVNPPSITVDPASLAFPSIAVGQKDTLELTVNSENLIDGVQLAIVADDSPAYFTISTTLLPKNAEYTVKVFFVPLTEGTFTKQLRLSSPSSGVADIVVNLSGEATGAIPEPEKEGDDYPLILDNPLTTLDEKFDDVTNNDVLSLSGWKNIAVENYRAWWGYTSGSDTDIESAAKATAYNSVNTAADPYEMWLITPPLDYAGATSKLFTFKVKAELIPEESADPLLQVYYIATADGIALDTTKIDGLNIPVLHDDNGEWKTNSIDFSETEGVADVFFIGFRFAATGGNENATVYYIDDVTYGIDNIDGLPSITQKDRVWVNNHTIYVNAGEKGNAVLYDTTGKKIGEYPIKAGESTLPAVLKQGIYILQIQYAGYAKSYKVIDIK